MVGVTEGEDGHQNQGLPGGTGLYSKGTGPLFPVPFTHSLGRPVSTAPPPCLSLTVTTRSTPTLQDGGKSKGGGHFLSLPQFLQHFTAVTSFHGAVTWES